MQFSSSSTKPSRSVSSICFRSLGILYFLLLACVIAYIWLVAQDRFISSSTFKISRQDASSADIGLSQLALPGLSDSGSADSQVAIGFIDSTDLLLALEKDFKLREHYASHSRDIIFRLETDALLEKRLDYYRNRISAHYDKETGLTMVSVDTFDPALSKEIAESVLKRTETFINNLNQNVADQQLVFIRNELDRAEKNVTDVSLEMLALQNANNLVSPDEAISAGLRAVQELKMERLRTETDLASMERDSPGSPRIDSMRSHLRSLDEQISMESTKISGPEQDRLNQVLARYKEVQIKLDFATKMRTGTETLLEKHRVDAAANSRFISIIQRPFLPEDVGYPERPYATITIIGLGILLFLILRVLTQSIYERTT